MGILSRHPDANGQELDFLPAALEVQERPPSPFGRAIIWTLMLLFFAIIAWAALGSADIVAVAQGRIIPSGHNKIIQPLEIGSVKSIHVSEGQRVAKGDLLLQLDDESVKADVKRIEQERANLRIESRRLTILESWLQGKKKSKANPTEPESSCSHSIGIDNDPCPLQQGGPEQLPPLQQQLLRAQWYEHLAALKAFAAEKRKRQAEKQSLQQQILKLESTLPLVTRRAETLHKLTEKKFLGEVEFLEMEQERLEMHHDLATNRRRLTEIDAAIAEIEAQTEQLQRKFLGQVLLERQENEKRIEALDQERIKAETRSNAYRLSSPIDGVVQQLAVHTLGGIVTPAQQLMTIIPDEDVLEVEALVENKDIGFVKEGQNVEVKIDAFPFTKYGVIDAVLSDLSNDAVTDEVRGLVYKAKVILKETRIRVDGKWVNLSPGMTVTAEVKTGTRRLIEFFLSPLLRYRQESIRER